MDDMTYLLTTLCLLILLNTALTIFYIKTIKWATTPSSTPQPNPPGQPTPQSNHPGKPAAQENLPDQKTAAESKPRPNKVPCKRARYTFSNKREIPYNPTPEMRRKLAALCRKPIMGPYGYPHGRIYTTGNTTRWYPHSY